MIQKDRTRLCRAAVVALTGAANLWFLSAYGNSTSSSPAVTAVVLHDLNWTTTGITWYLDGVAFLAVSKASLPAADVWEFDKPHILLLNMAVGGSVPGSPDATTVFPATMLVDWVRYYSN